MSEMNATDDKSRERAEEFHAICREVRQASRELAQLSGEERNGLLIAFADGILADAGQILQANAIDMDASESNGLPGIMRDRLMLNEARIQDMAKGVRDVAALPDPIGRVIAQRTLAAGPYLKKISVPLGVVGIIYEARPNVTADSIALCIKSANAALLRGGKEAIHSSVAIAAVFSKVLAARSLPSRFVHLIEDTSRETSNLLMRARGYVDVLIPRGGSGLIQAVMENASVPVIETGAGNCHAYVEKTANIEMAVEIIDNAKTQRPSVCNAIESLIVDREIAAQVLPAVYARLSSKGVEMRGDEETRAILGDSVKPASEEDYRTEYNDLILDVAIVDGYREAVERINRYSTSHSECIITEDSQAAEHFTSRVDSAAVYVNASTRFTDGGVFGLGAEIGISTQKLHARGPMGLDELTSYKYVVVGHGETRK